MARNYITQSSPGLTFRPFLRIHNHYLNIKKHTVSTEGGGGMEKGKSTACKDMMRPISDHITIFTAIWHCNDNKLLKIYYDKKKTKQISCDDCVTQLPPSSAPPAKCSQREIISERDGNNASK